jgi:streptogramin lyase
MREVARLDPTTRKVMERVRGVLAPVDISVASGIVWGTGGPYNVVARIDPCACKTSGIPVPGNPYELAAGGDSVWVSSSLTGTLSRIDPRTNRATSQLIFPILPNITKLDVWDVMVGDGSVWVHAEPHILFRIDPKAMASR